MSKLAWPKGLSLSFFTDKNLVVHGMEPDVLTKVKEHGFEVVELSFSHDDYFDLMKVQLIIAYCQSLSNRVVKIRQAQR